MASWGSEGLQGIAGTWVWTLGGVDKHGADACNGMTTALMEAARLVRVSNPTFALRWHPKVKDEVMREAFECIRHGLGYPSIRNDPILIANAMHWHGHPLEEARTWVHQACMSPCPTTKHGTQPMRMASATANMAKMIEYVFTNGYDYGGQHADGPQNRGPASSSPTSSSSSRPGSNRCEWMIGPPGARGQCRPVRKQAEIVSGQAFPVSHLPNGRLNPAWTFCRT